MADNNKNPRRTIWLSETEPLSHYDIWLSKNQHLNSDGEPLSDSGVQRPCDYIFKVWDCDNWYPIIGFNSTAVNKINTVYNTNYITTHNGHSINSSSYQEFHLPLFTSPNSSPQELFDAGTIGEAILEYVTQGEWQDIFEGDAFSLAFKWYIEEGDTNLDLLVNPAEADKLGGIYANEFQEDDMFPEEQDYHSQSDINNSYNWLAQAKYKLGYNVSNSEDYNLYISAKDIINAINQYQEDNPNEPGITPGGGSTIDPEVLYRSFYNSPTILKGWQENSISAQKPRFELAGSRLLENRGKIPMLRNDNWWEIYGEGYTGSYDDTNNALVWVSIDDIYPVLSEESHENGTRYVINGGGKENTYLNWEGKWTNPNSGNEYSAIYPIGINHLTNEISILPYQGNTSKLYLCSENNNVSWQPINTGGTEEYDAGDGIEIQTPQLGNKIIKGNIKECDQNGYNSGFSASTSIEFRAQSGQSVIKDVITLLVDGNTNSYNIHPYTYTKISLASGGDIKFVIDGQTQYVNGNPVYVILEILGKPNSYTIEIQDSQYSNSNDFISINNALTIGSSSYTFGCNVTKFLITMQFGIVKIEPLGYIESDRTEPESEPELEEPSEP